MRSSFLMKVSEAAVCQCVHPRGLVMILTQRVLQSRMPHRVHGFFLHWEQVNTCERCPRTHLLDVRGKGKCDKIEAIN